MERRKSLFENLSPMRRPSQQMTKGEQLGPLVRQWGVHPSQVPPLTATPEEISPFLQSILLEAVPFIADLPAPNEPTAASSWKYKSTKNYANCTGSVQLFERTVTSEELHDVAVSYSIPHVDTSKPEPETWTLRRSVHDDVAKEGTAAWDEWVQCFKIDHAVAEKKFTPTVMSTSVIREWNCDGVTLERGDQVWSDWTLKVEQSTHKLPAPLKPRVFPVLQATASLQGRREFLVVQIAALEESAKQEEEKRADGDEKDEIKGVYTSIERVRELEGEPGKIEWVMGTVSDAKGVLPAWVQKLATPGQIAKDVEKFMGWIAEERKNRDENGKEVGKTVH